MSTTHTYGYIRINIDDIENRVKLVAQRDQICAYITAYGLGSFLILSDVESGVQWGRPGFQELIGHVRCGMARTIIVTRADRLTRSIFHLHRFYALCAKFGCTVICLDADHRGGPGGDVAASPAGHNP